ncbi:hypothetical protein [Neolewinella sp.]|uniref:hypothetical protein n=1 Tax=Neolewinella sp. TaxID=2993543 RepID=UPI003B527B8B
MRTLFLSLLFYTLSNALLAQGSAEVFVTGGNVDLLSEYYDSHGFSTGIGIAPAYDFGGRWGLLRLEINVESFSGIQLPAVINQLVDVPAFADVPISVSHRTTTTGLTAYRAVFGSEVPLFSRIPNLRLTSGIGILIPGVARTTREVFAQTIENVPLSSEQAATFSVRDGQIVQAPFQSERYSKPHALYSIGLSYKVVERVRVFVSHESRFLPWRANYGVADYWRVGVAGTVWAGSQVQSLLGKR